MSRLPRPLARRIDRLARAAHRFHRFAHHPLCAAYRDEVFALGRWRVCRGCSLLALGAGLGLAAGAGVPRLSPGVVGAGAWAALAWTGAVLGLPQVRRAGKGATRLLPALGWAFFGVQGARGGGALAWLGGGLAFLGLAVWVYRRHGPWRGPCVTCPQREARPCEGFRHPWQRERAFRRRASQLLEGDSRDRGMDRLR